MDLILLSKLNKKASLVNGKIPAEQLPSYVDEIVEVSTYENLPSTGLSGKIYVTLDTNCSYRWSGTTYIIIGGPSQVTLDGEQTIVGDKKFDGGDILLTPDKSKMIMSGTFSRATSYIKSSNLSLDGKKNYAIQFTSPSSSMVLGFGSLYPNGELSLGRPNMRFTNVYTDTFTLGSTELTEEKLLALIALLG